MHPAGTTPLTVYNEVVVLFAVRQAALQGSINSCDPPPPHASEVAGAQQFLCLPTGPAPPPAAHATRDAAPPHNGSVATAPADVDFGLTINIPFSVQLSDPVPAIGVVGATDERQLTPIGRRFVPTQRNEFNKQRLGPPTPPSPDTLRDSNTGNSTATPRGLTVPSTFLGTMKGIEPQSNVAGFVQTPDPNRATQNVQRPAPPR